MRIITVLATLLAFPVAAVAQTGIESSDGTSSFILRDGGLILINFSDASVKFGLQHVVSRDPVRFGLDVKFKANDGDVSLVNDSKFDIGEVNAGLYTTYLWEPGKTISAHWATLQAGYERSKFRIAEVASPSSFTVTERTFDGFKVGGFYNFLAEDLILPGDLLFGASLQYGKRNNVGDLSKQRVCENSSTTAGKTLESCQDVRAGDYKTSAEFNAGADLLWYQGWAKNRFALDFFGRWDDANDNGVVPGIGLFFPEEGSPLKILGGVTFESVKGKLNVGIQAGISF